MWCFADHLAGYVQQDAHEFLMSVIDGIHLACTRSSTSSTSTASTINGKHSTECTCVVHRVFSGQLKSIVTCGSCGNNSSAFDPIFDISLDLKANVTTDNDAIVPPVPPTSTDSATAVPYTDIAHIAPLPISSDLPKISMEDCLRRFTQVERLSKEDMFKCAGCGSYTESSKQVQRHKVTCSRVESFSSLVRFELEVLVAVVYLNSVASLLVSRQQASTSPVLSSKALFPRQPIQAKYFHESSCICGIPSTES